jgi:uncharacterized membrane protein YgcG
VSDNPTPDSPPDKPLDEVPLSEAVKVDLASGSSGGPTPQEPRVESEPTPAVGPVGPEDDDPDKAGADARSSVPEGDSESSAKSQGSPPADTPSPSAPPAATLIEKWKTSSIPFLNKPFFKFVQLALVLGGVAVLVNNYFVPKEVRTGIEVTTFADNFARGDLTTFGSQALGKMSNEYVYAQQWVQFTGGFDTKSNFEDVFVVSQDQATLYREPKGKGAIFAMVRGFVPPTTVEARIAIPAIDAGVFFRYVDEDNWWALANEPLKGYYKIIRTVRGKSEIVGTTGENSILGSGYLLTVRLDPKGFDIFKDGSPVMRVNDSALASREAVGAGLFALSTRALYARWDDFVIREPPATPANVNPSDIDTDAVTPSTFVVPDSPIPQLPTNPSGISGASGVSGASGTSGASGASGQSGASGASGTSGASEK